jgi:ABC-type spermidine/putrescine transport system permease subunit II
VVDTFMKNYILGKVIGFICAIVTLILGIFAAIGVSYMAEKIEKAEEENKQNIK